MIKESTAFGIGIVVGVTAFAVAYGCYRYYKSNHLNKSENYDKDFERKVNQEKNAKSKTEELLSKQVYVDTLTAKEITTWFKQHKESVSSKAKMIITKPTNSILKKLGYISDGTINPEKSMIQLFYDMENNDILKIRLIVFENIEPNLEATVIENQGMIVFTD